MLTVLASGMPEHSFAEYAFYLLAGLPLAVAIQLFHHWLRTRPRCDHHWHPVAGGMVDWRCCWCGKDADGMPADRTVDCNPSVEHLTGH